MMLHKFAFGCLALTIALASQPASAMPIQTISCAPNADGSAIEIRITADGSESKSCTFFCHVKQADQSRFQGWSCDGTVAATPGEQLICALEGEGPGSFAEADLDRFVCS